MATRDQIQYLVAKNKASSMNTIEQDEELPEHPPAHLNRNQKAVKCPEFGGREIL